MFHSVHSNNLLLLFFLYLHLIFLNEPIQKKIIIIYIVTSYFFFSTVYKTIARNVFYLKNKASKPKASEVLTDYLKQCGEPPWTSYFVKYKNVENDQWGKSHFNWKVGNSNYHILRTGCYPYVKYHCTKRPPQNLIIDDYFFRFIKVLNLGIPCLAYGVAAIFLIRHSELVNTSKGKVKIYFLYPEDKGSHY